MDGELVNKIQKAIDKGDSAGGMRTKCVEDGGVSLRTSLVKSDPSGINRCKRTWCKICIIEKISGETLDNIRVSCFSTNICYGLGCTRTQCWNGEESTSVSIKVGQSG